MSEFDFYKRRDGSIFPTCKGCLTAHLDVTDYLEVLSILKELDIPFAIDEWIKYVERYPDSPKGVLGRYLSLMKLRGYRGYTYEDTYTMNEWSCKDKVKALNAAREQLIALAQNILTEFGQN
ncbi:MAG: hypothetical protein NC218_09405 [Acetobacter sp.]|nr:hypothetical protein [Acetobacter sp.]